MSPRVSQWMDWGPGRWMRLLFSPTMSVTTFFLDFYVYPVLSLFCLAVGAHDIGLLRTVALGGAGLFSWTLIEYAVHRVALHHIVWFRGLHDAHHAEPRGLIGTPTPVSLLIFYAAGYVPACLLFGRGTAAGWMSGLLVGYLSYVTAHWAVHHMNGNSYLLRRLKRQHAIHHHRSHDANFGVTSSFWDRLFGTYRA